MTRLLIATRSEHKLREISEILGQLPDLDLTDPRTQGIPEGPAEDRIECYDTFAQNALAKARYFANLTGLATLADDSGLCVDALGGLPGVLSKRFSGRADLHGADLDRSNNTLLLERLDGVAKADRAAHYQCSIILVATDGMMRLHEGRCDGYILPEPRGTSGFGYDPLFFVPGQGRTFAEMGPAEKNLISHRARALRLAVNTVRDGFLDASR
jgi:XTP/dITP diphosphohydrolase